MPPTPATATRRSTIIVYLVIIFLFWASLYYYVPTLPVYAQEKTNNLTAVGTILSMYGLWQMLLRFPLGILSDWLGRRRPFIFSGLLFSAVGALIMSHASGFAGLAAGRAFTGLAAATWVPLVVVFSALFPPHESVRASAILVMVNSLSMMVATSLNGWLIDLGGYALAFTLAITTAAITALITLSASEPQLERKSPSWDRIGRLVMRRDVLIPSLLSMVSLYASYTATFTFLPLLAHQYGASNTVQSLIVSGNLGVTLLANMLLTPLMRQLGPRTVGISGFSLMAAGLACAAWISSLAGVILAQAVIGLSIGLLSPMLMGLSIRNVVEAERATAMGLYQAIYAFGMFAGPWLSGIMATTSGILPMLAITAAGCIVLGAGGCLSFTSQQPVRS